MLAREVLRLRGTLASRETEWDVVVDLYFYRDPEAEENKEEETKAVEETAAEPAAGGFEGGDWGTAAPTLEGAKVEDTNWGADGTAAAPTWDASAAEAQPAASGW